MVCDSTNAMVEGHSGSEAEVRRSLSALIRGLRGRVAVTCFSSNVARIESISLAAREAGRSVALVGRSLRNLEGAARECGYLRAVPEFVSEDDAGSIPDDNLLILITGSQGEPRSALARVALDTHPRVVLGEGDTVIFSSRVIPGNERAIGTVQDNLVRARRASDDRHGPSCACIRSSRAGRAAPSLSYGEAQVTRCRCMGSGAICRRMRSSRERQAVTPLLLEDGDILKPGAWQRRGGGQRADRSAGAGWRPAGAIVGRCYGGASTDAVQRGDRGQPGGGRCRAAMCGEPRISAPGLFEAEDPETSRIAEEFAVGDCRFASSPAPR